MQNPCMRSREIIQGWNDHVQLLRLVQPYKDDIEIIGKYGCISKGMDKTEECHGRCNIIAVSFPNDLGLFSNSFCDYGNVPLGSKIDVEFVDEDSWYVTCE